MSITRRTLLGTAAAAVAAPVPAVAQECRIGPPKHEKGPLVFMDYDQVELDAAYKQEAYQPPGLGQRVQDRLAFASGEARAHVGEPLRQRYGAADMETLDIYRTDRVNAPIFVFIHGGTWRFGSAWEAGYPAEMFVKAGAHYIAIDFDSVVDVNGDLGVLAAQVRRAIAWVYRNAASFGGDPARLYVGGHSSGGHLCAVAMITNWPVDFNLPADVVKGGLCISGMYEMEPVRLSYRREYIAFTDEMADAMSPQRHIGKLAAQVVVSYGALETPEFQRQARDFAAAVKAAGKPVTLIKSYDYYHDEMAETLGNPYSPSGRAALAMMGLERS
jgi:arylformamidase